MLSTFGGKMAERGVMTGYYQEMLREQGYIGLPIGINGSDIDPLFKQFREFADLAWAEDGSGQELVDAMTYDVPGRPQDADYHMVHRRIGEDDGFSRTAATENKDLLHVGPLTSAVARQQLGTRMPGIMKQLLSGCDELYDTVRSSVQPVYRELGFEDHMLAADKLDDVYMIRLLRYLGTEATHKAELHFDRSVATLAVWESSPGLVGAPGNNTLVNSEMTAEELNRLKQAADLSPIDHISGEGKFFLGAGYNRLPEEVHAANGTLPLFAHGVLNRQSEEERDAVVVFMNPHLGVEGYKVPEKSETSLSHLGERLAKVPQVAKS